MSIVDAFQIADNGDLMEKYNVVRIDPKLKNIMINGRSAADIISEHATIGIIKDTKHMGIEVREDGITVFVTEPRKEFSNKQLKTFENVVEFDKDHVVYKMELDALFNSNSPFISADISHSRELYVSDEGIPYSDVLQINNVSVGVAGDTTFDPNGFASGLHNPPNIGQGCGAFNRTLGTALPAMMVQFYSDSKPTNLSDEANNTFANSNLHNQMNLFLDDALQVQDRHHGRRTMFLHQFHTVVNTMEGADVLSMKEFISNPHASSAMMGYPIIGTAEMGDNYNYTDPSEQEGRDYWLEHGKPPESFYKTLYWLGTEEQQDLQKRIEAILDDSGVKNGSVVPSENVEKLKVPGGQ